MLYAFSSDLKSEPLSNLVALLEHFAILFYLYASPFNATVIAGTKYVEANFNIYEVTKAIYLKICN